MRVDHQESCDNPLLEGMPRIEDDAQLRAKLAYDPLAGVAVSEMDVHARLERLHDDRRPHAPTETSLAVAHQMVSLVRSSYRSRNPVDVANRRRLLGLQFDADRERSLAEGLGVPQGFIVTGITGVGKSAAINRAMALFPQRIEHGRCEAAGWEAQVQIPVLRVPMSAEGSRGGFIQEILVAIDRCTGQDYASTYPRKFSKIDRLAVHIPILLHRYQVGVLIVEEMQRRNTLSSSQAQVMQLFLMAIMNAGIPMILVGNPSGFEWLESSSQNQRRLNYWPPVEVHPLEIQDPAANADWDAVFRAIRGYYLVDSPPVDDDAGLSHALRSLSGGIPDLAMNIWVNAQNLVLRGADGVVDFGVGVLKRYYQSTAFDKLRLIADGFTYRDPVLLKRCQDIPVQAYMKRWKLDENRRSSREQMDDSVLHTTRSSPAKREKRPVRESTKLAAAQTRKSTRKTQRAELSQQLDDQDLRRSGVRDLLLDGLDEMLDDD